MINLHYILVSWCVCMETQWK